MTEIIGYIESPTEIIGTVLSIGKTGERGLSAYEIWLAEGNTGTVLNFLDSLSAVSSYNLLNDKPKIEGIELVENKTFKDLGITIVSEDEIDNIF